MEEIGDGTCGCVFKAVNIETYEIVRNSSHKHLILAVIILLSGFNGSKIVFIQSVAINIKATY